jgi:acetyltransferase-like isoleucine patch superfamily enzyme
MGGAIIGRNCKIGEGCFIEGGVQIGDNVTIKNGCLIWDGVEVKDQVFIGPGVVFTNDLYPRNWIRPSEWEKTLIEKGVSIGANATVVCGTRLGKYSMIGAGAVISGKVPPFALMVGVPARRAAWICICSRKIEPQSTNCACGASITWDDKTIPTVFGEEPE